MMLDSRYAMWMLWGPELTFFCNDAYLPTVGIRREWVMGERSDKVWAEIWAEIWPRIDHVMTTGEATWDEGLLLFLERSGFPEETYHTFSYSPVYDDEGRIAGMLCVVTEATQQVLAERGLGVLRDLAARVPGATAEQALSRVMSVLQQDQMDVPFASLYLLNEQKVQARLVASFGQAPEGLRRPEFLLTGEDALLRVLRGSPAEMLDLRADSVPSGLWPETLSQAVVLPLHGAGDVVAGALAVGVSPRRKFDARYRQFMDLVAGQISAVLADAQAYEAERRRAESLAELDRAKTQFFSNVSHEFRTPLTLMLGPLAEALEDADSSPALRERLQLAQRNAQRLLRLVNSLLDFSRIEAGRVQAAYEATDIATLTEDLTSTFRSAMERAGLRLSVRAAPLSAPVWLDRQMWEKIVLNLLSNAYKFTLKGGIEVRVGEQNDGAVLDVIDTGVGVSEDAIPHLFERFYRVENSGGRTHEGSGIGLALVQELVRLHGGKISVSSRLGEGTHFRVALPFGNAHLPEQRIRTSDTETAPSAAVAYLNEALGWDHNSDAQGVVNGSVDRRFESTFGACVLLADDNADMRAYVAGLLTPAYRVKAVADGLAALESARQLKPDLIISDVMMPRLDGFGLMQALRSDPLLRDVPVILLSARAGEEARIEGLDSGADDYLIKPFSARELNARAGALLERARLHRQVLDEQRRAYSAAQRRSAQFEILLDETPLGMFLVDSSLRIVEVNPTATPLFASVGAAAGADLREVARRLWEPVYAEEIIGHFEHALRTGERYYVAERSERRAGTQAMEAFEWQVSRIPLYDGAFGVVCYFRDITAQVRARQQLEAADQQKDEFLAMLAHELRNPLAPIRTASELLQRTPQSDPRVQGAAEIIKRQASHLMRLVDDLLDISRITRARIELKRKDVSLAEVIAQALETVEPMLREKGHRVSTACDAEPLMVNGDPARLVQCVTNLLTNAIKYTDPGGRIGVETRAEGDQAIIEVSDNGTGVASDLLPHIFDLFVQSHRTLDRSQGGLGIGLTVVRRLIEMHGGSVAARSEGPGRGSVFSIHLPRVLQAAASPEQASANAIISRRVLVVDDNQDAAQSLAMLMSLDGHEVEAVFLPEQALQRVELRPPEVILLDIGLPGMDGYEVARRVRAMPGGQSIRLIALTGYGQAEDRRRALDAGFNEHLVKPVETEKLQQALEGAGR
ncbi:MAG TPA: ATP-binding protein [Steroidobacteraceae bacterium]|nr:ATP-binding protein [Steroidobacteraceae bacterium]